MTPYIKEYYQHGTTPVMIIMTPQRNPLQAWYPDTETQRLARLDTLILDIRDHDMRVLSVSQFEEFCNHHGIDTAIPEKGIELSFRLAALREHGREDYMPVPVRADNTAPSGNNDNTLHYCCF